MTPPPIAPPIEATDADDRGLCELARSVPMRGSIAYALEREPSFLAMTRAQGERAKLMVVKERDRGRIVASALGAPRRVYLNGEPTPILYAGDLKAHPEHQKRGIAGIVCRGVTDAFPELALGFGTVLRDNEAVLRFFGRSTEYLQLHPIADVDNYTVFFARRRSVDGVRRATARDAAEMVALFDRVHRARQLAPVLDAAHPEKALLPWPGLSLDDYRVLVRDGRIVAFAAVWDAYALKQVRLLSLSPALSAVRVGYNAFARLAGRPRLPPDGEHLRFLYVTMPCAASATDLGLVLRAIEAEHGRGEHVYFDIAFDAADPLRHALDGFVKTSVPMRAALLTWGARLGQPPALDGRPVYFDAALV